MSRPWKVKNHPVEIVLVLTLRENQADVLFLLFVTHCHSPWLVQEVSGIEERKETRVLLGPTRDVNTQPEEDVLRGKGNNRRWEWVSEGHTDSELRIIPAPPNPYHFQPQLMISTKLPGGGGHVKKKFKLDLAEMLQRKGGKGQTKVIQRSYITLKIILWETEEFSRLKKLICDL